MRGHGHWFAPTSLSWMPEGLLMRLTSSVPLFTCKGSVPKSPWARGLVLAGLLAAGVLGSPVRAATTLNSGTTTVSTGTDYGGPLYVATTGTATLNVIAGGNVTNTTGYLGFNAGSKGTATVAGGGTAMVANGSWNSGNYLYVGYRGAGTLNVSGGTWATNGNLTVGSSGTGTLTMSGGLVSVSGTVSQGTHGTIHLNSGGALEIGVGGTTGVLGVSTLTNNGTLIFSRSNASTYTGVLSGSGAVTKLGGGTLTLSGSSSYTGATAVNGGKLLVNGQLGNTAVAVNASGLLGGSGTILGNVTVGSSGTLAPGNSPGVFTVGSLSLLAGSHTLMEITGTAAGFYDQIVGTALGGLTYGSSLNLVMTGSYADQTTFQLFSNFSSNTGDFSAVGLNATGEYAGLTFAGDGGVWTSTETANGQRLVFSTGTGDLIVVPEPSTWVMGAVGLACAAWGGFRRRKQSLRRCFRPPSTPPNRG